MGVEIWFGLPGSGKSYCAVYRLWLRRKLMPKTRVFTNMPLSLPGDGPIYLMRDFPDFLAAVNGVVLLDEINLWMPARVWAKVPGSMLHKFAQVRKAELDIWATAQHPSRVDRVVRELAWGSAHMRSFVKLGFFLGRMVSGCGGPRSFMSWSVVPMLKAVGSCYGTMEYITPASYVRDVTASRPTSPSELETLRIDRGYTGPRLHRLVQSSAKNVVLSGVDGPTGIQSEEEGG